MTAETGLRLFTRLSKITRELIMQEYIDKDNSSFSSISAYMSSPISTIHDLNKCYSFLINFLEEINSDEFYGKGFLQIEGAVEKFLKCACNNGYDNKKEYEMTISVSKNLANYILRYINTTENFIDFISSNFFKKNNHKKILKNNCKELFLLLFNKINSIYTESLSKKELINHHFDIFDFYKPSEIDRYKSTELLVDAILIITNDSNLNSNEKNKIISRIKAAEREIDNTNPILSDILGLLSELAIILKSIAIGADDKLSINEAKDKVLKSISTIEESCINASLIKSNN